MVDTAHLGKGTSFPFNISKTGVVKRGVSFTKDELKVIQAIRYLLSTPIGSRPMRRDWGSRLYEIPFNPIDEAAMLADDFVIEAIRKFEPRVSITESNTYISPTQLGQLEIQIIVLFTRTQKFGNLVFPFFLNDFQETQIGEARILNIFGTGV